MSDSFRNNYRSPWFDYLVLLLVLVGFVAVMGFVQLSVPNLLGQAPSVTKAVPSLAPTTSRSQALKKSLAFGPVFTLDKSSPTITELNNQSQLTTDFSKSAAQGPTGVLYVTAKQFAQLLKENGLPSIDTSGYIALSLSVALEFKLPQMYPQATKFAVVVGPA